MLSHSKLILLLFIHLVVGIIVGHFMSNKNILSESKYIVHTVTKTSPKEAKWNISSHVEIVNLNKSVDTNFKCMKTKTLLNHFSSYICLYESQKDIYVSNAFRESTSIWEEEGVTRILNLLIRHPHLDFIDIGANIGSYTMYAAALGRFVLAIDCFAPNNDRIRRAVQLANTANRVVLIQNALYTHTGQYLRLSNDARNVGGQELDISTNQTYNQSLNNNPYIVKTIKFDELVPILTARGMRGAIMKIDIEGSESFVVEGGSQVFDLFDIPYVQIEWLKVRAFPRRTQMLVDFFTKRNYEPKTFQCNPLNLSQVAKWPDDLCWVKRNTSLC